MIAMLFHRSEWHDDHRGAIKFIHLLPGHFRQVHDSARNLRATEAYDQHCTPDYKLEFHVFLAKTEKREAGAKDPPLFQKKSKVVCEFSRTCSFGLREVS